MSSTEIIEITVNDRLGKKCRVKCSPDDTIGDVKKLAAAILGTRPDRMKFQKQRIILKDNITIGDYEIKDGMNIELYYN